MMTNEATILIVDDEQAFLDAIANTLRAKNFKVLQALNGSMGCKVAERFMPDIIIMDWEMPEMNGIEAIKYLKSQTLTQDIPVIMATGAMISVENLEQALQVGAIDFIRKPIDLLEVEARILATLKLSKSYQKIKEQKREVEELNDKLNLAYKEIKENHKNLTDGIAYAKRIQEAILPLESQFKENFSEYFIFYKPLDIVSGDFYWMEEQKVGEKVVKVIITVVDCTGHGVPGAFMSMIANELLNQVVHNRNISHADEILNGLHDGIRYALRQQETLNRDGMDMALCVIDYENQILEYAGAHSPLLLFQDGEMTLIKGDKISVGGFQPDLMRKFTKHVIPLKKDTVFYLFSDGFQDQFGMVNGKERKFMSKRFYETLADMHKLPLKEQKYKIDKILKDWMQNAKQMDDISVVGIKI